MDQQAEKAEGDRMNERRGAGGGQRELSLSLF